MSTLGEVMEKEIAALRGELERANQAVDYHREQYVAATRGWASACEERNALRAEMEHWKRGVANRDASISLVEEARDRYAAEAKAARAEVERLTEQRDEYRQEWESALERERGARVDFAELEADAARLRAACEAALHWGGCEDVTCEDKHGEPWNTLAAAIAPARGGSVLAEAIASVPPLPMCPHGCPLIDGGGDLLEPPCGCRADAHRESAACGCEFHDTAAPAPPAAVRRCYGCVFDVGHSGDCRIVAALTSAQAELAKLQAFKDYTHKRMDEAGVPADPPGPHRDAGCRIGQRFDVLVGDRDEFHRLYRHHDHHGERLERELRDALRFASGRVEAEAQRDRLAAALRESAKHCWMWPGGKGGTCQRKGSTPCSGCIAAAALQDAGGARSAAFEAGRAAYLAGKECVAPPQFHAEQFTDGYDAAHREWIDEIDAKAKPPTPGAPPAHVGHVEKSSTGTYYATCSHPECDWHSRRYGTEGEAGEAAARHAGAP